MSPGLVSFSSKSATNCLWFQAFARMKLTILVTASTTWFIFHTDLHNTTWCIIQCKNVNFCHFILHSLYKTKIFPVKFGQPSVVTPASLSHFSPNLSKHAFTSVNKLLQVVVPLIDCMAASFFGIWQSAVIPRKKISSWAVSRTLQLSSKPEKNSPSRPLCSSAEAPSFPQCPQPASLLCRESGSFSNVPFFSGHISATESNKHSLINSSSENAFFLGVSWHLEGNLAGVMSAVLAVSHGRRVHCVCSYGSNTNGVSG